MRDLNEEYRDLCTRMDHIIAELDRLRLDTVAVHIDHAMRKLELIIAGGSTTSGGIKAK